MTTESERLVNSIKERRARVRRELGPAATDFYHALLRAFPDFGGPPDAAWMEREAAARGLSTEATLAALSAADVIQRDPATGVITVAYPFSGVPTPHIVTIAGGRPVHAMCAIDALGIPFMLGRDATVVSSDPTTGEEVRVTLRGGVAQWEPPGVVVLYGKNGEDGPTSAQLCPTINFFASSASAEAYQQAHRHLVDVHLLDQAAAVRSGIRSFGNLLVADETVECDEECCC
ncbi:MAG: alkylmercury lyase family protein [Dehalococcoidia bacterium]